jgi:protein-disulfide isomerase
MLGKNNNILSLSVLAAAIILAGVLVYIDRQSPVEVLPMTTAAEKAIAYINGNLLSPGLVASLLEATDEGEIYKIRLEVKEGEAALGEFSSYVSQDGRFVFPEGYSLDDAISLEESAEVEVTKADRPDVKLFVMSYCPYGLQAQKMFLPVYELLKDKADMKVYFVNYIMHEKQEIDENLNQYCLQKEQPEKYGDYLNCFVQSGNTTACLSQVGANQEKLSACTTQTDQEYSIYSLYNDKSSWLGGAYPRFDVNTDLNEKYDVQGSPTIVINDQVVNVNSRSPEGFKNIVCQAFSSEPEECSQLLSEEVPSAGIGSGVSASSDGSCS